MKDLNVPETSLKFTIQRCDAERPNTCPNLPISIGDNWVEVGNLSSQLWCLENLSVDYLIIIRQNIFKKMSKVEKCP